MVTPRDRQKSKAAGFTLIELIVTITILAFLALLGAPLTKDWIDGVKQMQARNLMLEGMGQVRAMALRNPLQLSRDEPVAVLRVSQHQAQVLLSGRTIVWQAELQPSISLKTTGSADFGSVDAFAASADAFRCVAFNSRGMRLSAAAGCSLPLTHARVAIGTGNKEPLYVEIL